MKNGLDNSGSESSAGEDVPSRPVVGHSLDSPTVSFAALPSFANHDSGISGDAKENDQTVISQRPVAAPEEFYRSLPLAELAEMLEGRQLDHFAVQQMIGGGGMGAVFRGVDLRLDRVVAIKVIPASKRDPETLRRFRLEAQAAARLDHPNIARVFYVGEAEQWNYIVFEFIDGINIRDLVELEGPLSVDDAVFYTRQVAEALQHAHDREVVHRDIKPSNVLVTVGGVAKVVDMGLARDTSLDKSTADATASGVTLGTFDYISPEQARNPRDADVRSDLYSLGCTFFYMLTGHPPFPEGTALQKLLNHGSLPPPDPRGWREDLSDQLYEIMMKLMAKRPIDRYQKPAELVNDLLLLAEIENLPRSQGPTTLMLSPSVAQRTLLEANLPWIVALAFLLGSTLWLQSQTLSGGYALPELKFVSQPKVVAPAESSKPPLETEASTAPLAVPLSAGKTEGVVTDQVNSAETMLLGPEIPMVGVPPNKIEPTIAQPKLQPVVPGTTSQPVVVSPTQPIDISPQNWETSLFRALQRAPQQEQPFVIEVRGSVTLDRPLGLSNQKVILRGDRTLGAQIDLTRAIGEELSSGDGVILLTDSSLEIEQIDFRARLDGAASIGQSLVQARGSTAVRVNDCRFTIDGDTTADSYFLSIGTSEDSSSGSVPLRPNAVSSTTIAIGNCFFRGNASLLKIVQRNPRNKDALEVSIEDTLVALSGRVLDLEAGTGDWGTERIVRLFCERSTFAAAEGFAKLAYWGAASPLVGLSRTSQSCVFWSQPEVPHITIHGESASLLENPDLLLMQGLDNAYDGNIENLCQTNANGTRIFDLGFADGQQEGWFSERGTERVVRWEKPIESIGSFVEEDTARYQLIPSRFVPGYRSKEGLGTVTN